MPSVKIFNQGLGDYATVEYCVNKLGVEPEHALLAQAIQGDTSDNIPGIPGVGKVTAAKLIEQFGTLEKILEEGPSLKGKLGEKIAAGKDSARISMRLVSLYDDLELDLKPAKIDFSLIKEDLMIYGINL
jgi:DNA polymerase-1